MRNINQTIDFMTLRDDKERVKTSREELGKFFYDLAKMVFGAMVLGSGVALVTNHEDTEAYLILLSIGMFTTVFLSGIGNKILKGK